MSEQNIADRTATQCSNTGNNHHAKPVHAAPASGQCPGHGFSGNGDQVKYQQHGGSPCEKARSLAIKGQHQKRAPQLDSRRLLRRRHRQQARCGT